jgi:hypothetical protein
LILNFQESGHPESTNFGVGRALSLEFFQLAPVKLPPDSAPLSSVELKQMKAGTDSLTPVPSARTSGFVHPDPDI